MGRTSANQHSDDGEMSSPNTTITSCTTTLTQIQDVTPNLAMEPAETSADSSEFISDWNLESSSESDVSGSQHVSDSDGSLTVLPTD